MKQVTTELLILCIIQNRLEKEMLHYHKIHIRTYVLCLMMKIKPSHKFLYYSFYSQEVQNELERLKKEGYVKCLSIMRIGKNISNRHVLTEKGKELLNSYEERLVTRVNRYIGLLDSVHIDEFSTEIIIAIMCYLCIKYNTKSKEFLKTQLLIMGWKITEYLFSESYTHFSALRIPYDKSAELIGKDRTGYKAFQY